MAELPSGTVTFLFTDVEGSTRLLKQLRDAYGQVLADHRRILRAAFAEHGGQEIDTQGDAFFVAFPRARDAALAASAGQRGLAAHAWPEGGTCVVRMGLHTGEPAVGEEGYHGLGVHRAARIMAAGHGGQVLVSQSTTSVLEDDELPGLRLRDLGEHLLKDLDRPERIYQLDTNGLPTEFPPLRTADAPTAFSGREDELEHAARSAVWGGRFRTRRWLTALVASLLVLAGAVALVLGAFRGSRAHALAGIDGNAVGFVSAKTNSVVDEVAVGETPSHVASGNGAVWVTNTDSNDVSRIDPDGGRVVQTIPVGSSPGGITTGAGAVWVANSLSDTVSRVDPGTNREVDTIDVGSEPLGIVYARGSVWVANTGDATITRIDARTDRRTGTLPIAATELAFGAGTLWASERAAGRVIRIDPATGKQVGGAIQVGNGPTGIAFGGGSAWVANTLDGTVSRIDPETNGIRAAVLTGNGPSAVAVDARGAWVSNEFDGTLARIEPGTNHVAQRVRVGNRPQGLVLHGGNVLVTVRQSGVGHRGGVLRVRTPDFVDSIDPAVGYGISWVILRMTNDGLVAYNHASGLAGTQLVPNLAVALPAPADGGRTYTFRLRPNIRYSNGRPVEASDVRASLERYFEIGKQPVSYYDGIVGAGRCKQDPKHCSLSRGIVADDAARTVTFHLVAPDAEFLYKLALDFAYLLPAGTPAREAKTRGLPATGPYMIASYRPGHTLRLVRNPAFREWSKAAQPDGYPDRIVFEIGGSPAAAANAVVHGRGGVFSSSLSVLHPPSKQLIETLRLRYASEVHSNAAPHTTALFLNTRVAPFNRLDARRALNYAVDRAAAVGIVGGPGAAQATCQVLPPGFPGYRRYCPYRPAPDLAKANALVDRSGTRGMRVTYWSDAYFKGFAPFAVGLLRSLGYRVSTKTVGGYSYYGAVGDSRNAAQIGITDWISDYPAASAFVNPLLSCAAFVTGSNTDNSNDAEFCDHRLDSQIRTALTAQVTNPYAARGLWQRVDRQIVDQAPWVPLLNSTTVDVLSKGVGNYQSSPNGFGMLIDQLWVR